MRQVRTAWLKRHRVFFAIMRGRGTPQYNELKESIEKNGILEPLNFFIGVEDGLCRLQNGHHRLSIAEDLGLETVPMETEIRRNVPFRGIRPLMRLKNKEVRIENTSICNANCTICPRDKFTRAKTTMPVEHFRELAIQAKYLGADTVSIFGYGEPLCDPTIVEKVKVVTELGLESFITTNASLLNTDLSSRLLDAGLRHIRFSVHGLWDNYERVHRGLKFADVLRNTSNFIKQNRGQAKISVSVIPMRNEKIETFRDFWEYRVDWLEIWKPHNWTTGRAYRKKTKERKLTCGRPACGPIQIQADGKVIVCCFVYNGELEVGDTYKESIEDILGGDEFNSIREKHRNGDLSGLICATCDQLNVGDTNPLLYSNRDPECNINVTSSTKFKLEENEND